MRPFHILNQVNPFHAGQGGSLTAMLVPARQLEQLREQRGETGLVEEGSFSLDGLDFTWRGSPTVGVGYLAVKKIPGRPLPYQMLCNTWGKAQFWAPRLAMAFRAGRLPVEGVFRNDGDLPMNGAGAPVRMAKGVGAMTRIVLRLAKGKPPAKRKPDGFITVKSGSAKEGNVIPVWGLSKHPTKAGKLVVRTAGGDEYHIDARRHEEVKGHVEHATGEAAGQQTLFGTSRRDKLKEMAAKSKAEREAKSPTVSKKETTPKKGKPAKDIGAKIVELLNKPVSSMTDDEAVEHINFVRAFQDHVYDMPTSRRQIEKRSDPQHLLQLFDRYGSKAAAGRALEQRMRELGTHRADLKAKPKPGSKEAAAADFYKQALEEKEPPAKDGLKAMAQKQEDDRTKATKKVKKYTTEEGDKWAGGTSHDDRKGHIKSDLVDAAPHFHDGKGYNYRSARARVSAALNKITKSVAAGDSEAAIKAGMKARDKLYDMGQFAKSTEGTIHINNLANKMHHHAHQAGEEARGKAREKRSKEYIRLRDEERERKHKLGRFGSELEEMRKR